MEQKINGGPAFPDPGRAQSAKQREVLTDTGMSLRDYFAAKAMLAIVGDNANYSVLISAARKAEEEVAPFVAAAAYELADAMLAERAK